MEKFETSYQLFDYLNKNRFKILDYDEAQLSETVVSIFGSPLLDDQRIMMQVDKWFKINVYENFSKLVRDNYELMGDIDLSLYKFTILIKYRGPMVVEHVESFILGHILTNYLQAIAKHKDFPMNLRKVFYETTGDVEYLPKEAQDIFVF